MELSGGVNKITLIDGLLHRPGQPWSQQVQSLLAHLASRGFAGAPQSFGFDADAREMVSYLPGTTLDASTVEQFQTDKVLVSAARLLRQFHDATSDYQSLAEHPWQIMPTSFEHGRVRHVICHNDFAPYNCVLNNGEVTGIFDFDTAAPGPPRWDLAYAVFRFCPLFDASNPETFGSIEEQRRRLHLFCQEYGTSCDLDLVDLTCERVRVLIRHMQNQAAAGHQAFAGHIADGHDTSYEKAIDHIESNRQFLSTPM